MFDNVTRARDQGVSLAFLSGNSVYGEVALAPRIDGRPDRIFRRVRPFSDETLLMGTASRTVGLGDWRCRAPGHWVFEGTGMQEGDAIPGLVGWEFNGPPLLNDPSLVVLARGPIQDAEDHRLTHAAVLYDGPKGNIVFNAGTCWWNMPLSAPMGRLALNGVDFRAGDARVQRITRNVLDRMRAGAGPGLP